MLDSYEYIFRKEFAPDVKLMSVVDKKGVPYTDWRAERVGLVGSLDILCFPYIDEETGYFEMYYFEGNNGLTVRTSLGKITSDDGETIVITTLNSVYTFKRV